MGQVVICDSCGTDQYTRQKEKIQCSNVDCRVTIHLDTNWKDGRRKK